MHKHKAWMLKVIKEITKKAIENTKLNTKNNIQKNKNTFMLKTWKDNWWQKKILMEIKAAYGYRKEWPLVLSTRFSVLSGGSMAVVIWLHLTILWRRLPQRGRFMNYHAIPVSWYFEWRIYRYRTSLLWWDWEDRLAETDSASLKMAIECRNSIARYPCNPQCKFYARVFD